MKNAKGIGIAWIALIACGCGGTVASNIHQWTGTVNVDAMGMYSDPANNGTESMSYACTLQGASGAAITENYTVSNTSPPSGCSISGTLNGQSHLDGEAAVVACAATLNPNFGTWSVGVEMPGGSDLQGVFTQMCPPPVGNSTKMDDWAGEDFWSLGNVTLMATGTTMKNAKSLDGMTTFSPTTGSGTITMKWALNQAQ